MQCTRSTFKRNFRWQHGDFLDHQRPTFALDEQHSPPELSVKFSAFQVYLAITRHEPNLSIDVFQTNDFILYT